MAFPTSYYYFSPPPPCTHIALFVLRVRFVGFMRAAGKMGIWDSVPRKEGGHGGEGNDQHSIIFGFTKALGVVF